MVSRAREAQTLGEIRDGLEDVELFRMLPRKTLRKLGSMHQCFFSSYITRESSFSPGTLPGENSTYLEKIQRTWRKFNVPGENSTYLEKI